MSHKISSLFLPDRYKSEIEGVSDEDLGGLNKLNIFVGPNNSGKSNLLRHLLTDELVIKPTWFSLDDYNSGVKKYQEKFATNAHAPFVGNAVQNMPGLEEHLRLREFGSAAKTSRAFFESLEKLKATPGTIHGITHAELGTVFLDLATECLAFNGERADNLLEFPKFRKLYIPLLRGLRTLDEKHGDLYSNRTMSDYFTEKKIEGNQTLNIVKFKSEVEIFSGLRLYNIIRSFLLGDLRERTLARDFEKFLSHEFFEREEIVLIPKEGKDVLSVKVGTEVERPIFELGDGLQALMTILFPLFINQNDNVLCFIEEPEQCLHPGLQRQLVEVLLKHPAFSNHQLFVTTHSNHFLDLMLDFDKITLFRIRKEITEESGFERVPNFRVSRLEPGDSAALTLLGAQISSVFLSNSTIWVEGVTDRLYWRHYLKLYLSSLGVESIFKEDLHYTFVEYGGSNVTHFVDLKADGETINLDRVCGPLMLLADNDPKKEDRKKALREALPDRVIIYDRREVENLLSKDVLLSVVKEYEKVDDDNFYKSFEYEDYKDVSLGTFIESSILTDRQRRGSYAKEYGVLTDKPTFCKKALKYIKSVEDMSEDALRHTHVLKEFIISNNPDLARLLSRGQG